MVQLDDLNASCPTATPSGAFNSAEAALPPSPLSPFVPLPAIVVIVSPDTLRIRLLLVSAMYRFPELSVGRGNPLGTISSNRAALSARS